MDTEEIEFSDNNEDEEYDSVTYLPESQEQNDEDIDDDNRYLEENENEDNDDEEDDKEQLVKINDELSESSTNLITDTIVVDKNDRKTKPYLTRYEICSIIALYITHRKNGQLPFVDCSDSLTYEEEAKLAISKKTLPYIVIRKFQNKIEHWKLEELHI